ncbi:MAG: serine/threonine protein kinase [Bdellovibrionaceae bacterium]|nr:serine/threonine protein kinase [Pseudobdellovibrionaceae bacterium]
MISSAWGAETKYFYAITPEKILDAVEAGGLLCTGRCLPLNSMENRVYEVEIELDEAPENPSDRFRIAKFYRPGRWTKEQILEEHQFLQDLEEAEIPVVAPLKFENGETLRKLDDIDVWYTLFPKRGGRNPDELTNFQVDQIGRLLARLHAVGASRQAPHRLQLSPQTYGIENLKYLVDSRVLPAHIEQSYKQTVETICKTTAPWFEAAEVQRIHGDSHLGNLLLGSAGLFWVDFDDMVRGPCVQDVWLLLPGRDEYTVRQRDQMLEAYCQMRDFNYSTLRLIEPLRALRFVHFSAWISKRWEDPAFPRAFPQYGDARYWEQQLMDLREQLALIQQDA